MPFAFRARHRRALVVALGALLTLGGHPATARAQRIRDSIPLKVLKARLARDTNDPEAYFNLAVGYWAKKKYARADSLLRTAVALDPEYALAHLAISLVRLPDKHYWKDLKRHGGDTAVVQDLRYRGREYQRAFMIDPFLDLRPLGLFPHGYDTTFTYMEAVREYARDRLGRQRDSLPAGFLWMHALAAVHSNRLSAAIADIQTLALVSREKSRKDSIGPAPLETEQALYMLAALLQRDGRSVDAIRLYQTVLGQDIGNYEAHEQLAAIFEGENDWGQALAERRAAVDVFPEDHCLVTDLGVTQYHAGALPDAEATLREAQAAGPRDPQPDYWLGVVAQARGEAGPARKAFAEFLALAPRRDSVRIAEVRHRIAALPAEAP